MSSPFDKIPVPEVSELPAVPMTFASTLQENEHLGYVVARIDCEALSLRAAFLCVDPARDRISLISPCGCHVHQSLARMLMELSNTLAREHPNAFAATDFDAGAAFKTH